MVAGDDKTALTFSLSPGNSHDAPEGRLLWEDWDNKPEGVSHLAMDKAYEGDETRQLVINFGWDPVVPPKSNRIDPWELNRAAYAKRNEVERLFRRLKGFRRIFTRFEKLDTTFKGFIFFSLIAEIVRFMC